MYQDCQWNLGLSIMYWSTFFEMLIFNKVASKQLKKNSATLKRESAKFEPMRKPDILKLRRESLR